MKKLGLALVTGIAMLSLAACGGNKEKRTENSTPVSSKVEEVKEKGSDVLENSKDSVSDAVENGKRKTSEVVEKGKEKVEEGKTKASTAIEGASKELESSSSDKSN